MMTPRVFVFLGPTMSHEQARQLLPHAYFLPPAKAGDILHTLRWNPQVILLIDGYFENTPAVWHKEILCAMHKGISVYGASSMGALRAAELAEFGMTGIGKVFDDFRSGRLEDDDEVAILHEPAERHFAPITDAMVNIRATLMRAVQEDIIDHQLSEQIIHTAKISFYQRRTLKQACEKMVSEMGIDHGELDKLYQWVQSGGYVDVKYQDAIKALTVVNSCLLNDENEQRKEKREGVASSERFAKTDSHFSNTMYFASLQYKINTKPYHTFNDWLPIHEKVLQSSRLLTADYILVKYIAGLSSIVYGLARKRYPVLCDDSYEIEDSLQFNASDLAMYDLSEGEYAVFKTRQRFIVQFFYDQTYPIDDQRIKENMPHVLRLMDQFESIHRASIADNQTLDMLDLLKKTNLPLYQKAYFIAYGLLVIDNECRKRGLTPHDTTLLAQVKYFCQEKQLMSHAALDKWLLKNQLNRQTFLHLITFNYYLHYFVIKHNLFALGASCSESTLWVRDALYLTNLYLPAKQLLLSRDAFDRAVGNVKDSIEKKGKAYLYQLDFDGGLAEWAEFIRQIELFHSFS